MAIQPQRTFTYEDLSSFPDDNFRRELIDGELIVTASPSTNHQRVVAFLVHRLMSHTDQRGGEVLPAPYDVRFSDTDVVEPDVLYVKPENMPKLEQRFLAGPADVVVEVSSPSTRRLEIHRKLRLYERFQVPEYWYVDIEAERVEVYRLTSTGYEHPRLLSRAETLTSPELPGFSLDLEILFGRLQA